MLFANTQLAETMKTHRFIITDVTDAMPPDPMGDLAAALEVGPVGVAFFDEEVERRRPWSFWVTPPHTAYGVHLLIVPSWRS